MASVHFGRLNGPAGFSRVVAIKRMHATFAKDPEFVAMFLEEARLAARVRHPNVVAPLDVVAMEGETFLVMEYVHGESLAKLWRATGAAGRRIDPRVVGTIMSGVLHGLHAAHDAKDERGRPLDIVHRDISPQNIMVTSDGVARVLDFGVAKATGRVQATREGRIKGKLAYMPPEQLHGAAVTRRADVYAAAVVTWELLTGKRAFARDNEAAVVTAVLGEPLPAPSKIATHLPPEVDLVVMRGLNRNPTRRYTTAQEMALDLERAVGVAPMSEVADWVRAHARGDLTRRALRIAALERMIGTAAPPLSLADQTPTRRVMGGAESGAADSGTETPHTPSSLSRIAVSSRLARLTRQWAHRRTLWLALVVCSMVGALAAAHRLSTTWRAPIAAQTAASATPVFAAASVPPALSAPPVTERTVPEPTVAPDVAAPGTAERKRPWVPPSRATAPASRARPRNDCNPPFTVDENGHKHFKAACLE
jgi:eukaryotic-like serine/threonine-protein kinase